MGQLYDLIKNELEDIKKIFDLKNKNFIQARNFNNVRDFYKKSQVLLCLTKEIDYYGRDIFANNNEYHNYVKAFFGPDAYSIPEASIEKDEIKDYETFLNNIEAKMTKDQRENITVGFITNKQLLFLKPSHPFNEEVKKMKADVNSFNENEIPEEEKQKIISSLDYANNMLIKKSSGYMDDIIDTTARTRNLEAFKHTDEFIANNNINVNALPHDDHVEDITDVVPNNKAKGDVLKPLIDKKLSIKPELIKKLKDLDNLVKDKKILKSIVAGESGSKEYGFDDWFNKARELNKAMFEYTQIDKNNKELMLNKLRGINKLSDELKDVTERYKDVLKFIKDNFDLNKISLPRNIYSGRTKISDNLEDYSPDLAQEFDEENAPYGVILNCYSQLKSFCNEGNMTLDEFIENPVKSYLNICKNKVNNINNKFILPRNGNSLGKRMARMLVQNVAAYHETAEYANKARSLVFFTHLSDYDENTLDNIFLTLYGEKYASMLDQSGEGLFYPEYGTNNLKNLFILGDDRDNLLTLSDRYIDDNFNFADTDALYNERISQMGNVNPVDECNRMINVLTDYFVERKNIFNTKLSTINDHYKDACKPGYMFMAAKEYFTDYLSKNDIDITMIRNEEDRKKVLEFAQNPAEAYFKYSTNKDIFVRNVPNESEVRMKNKFGDFWSDKYKTKCEEFVHTFDTKNNEANGYNSGKNITNILSANKGGIWERFIARSTSPQYKALVEAIEEALNPDGFTYGDLELVKLYAKKYLDYKLNNQTYDDLSTTGKKRVEFCRTILDSLNSLDDKYKDKPVSINAPANDLHEPHIGNNPQIIRGVEINPPLQDLKEPRTTNNSFHDKIKDNLNKDKEEDIEEKEIDNDYIIKENDDIVIKNNNI